MLNDKVTAIELMPSQFYLDFFHSLKWNVVSALFKDFHPGYFPRSFVGLVNDSSAQLQGDSVIWINLCSHITFNIIMIRFSSRYPEMLKNFEPRQRRNLLNGNVSVFVCAELHKKDPQERMTRLKNRQYCGVQSKWELPFMAPSSPRNYSMRVIATAHFRSYSHCCPLGGGRGTEGSDRLWPKQCWGFAHCLCFFVFACNQNWLVPVHHF